MGSSLMVGEDWMSISLHVKRAFCAVYILAALGVARPTITFPINSQVPPVARVSKPFIFTFSESTFSGTSPLEYAMSDAPTWLSFNGLTRTISGIAPASAANTAPVIQITATDLTGSVTMNATLVVSGNPGPSVAIPMENQLAALGKYSPPSSILYYPSAPFNIVFDPETFSPIGLNYYAVTSDNTPLPSWITFDGAGLSFSGKTPDYYSLIQPPQTWGLQLIASDVLGFAGIAIEFNIVVGNHELNFKDGILAVNGTEETFLNITSLISNLYLDGNVAEISDIANANATAPEWLQFSNSTLSLSGTPPAGTTPFNVTVTVQDIYGDIANATVCFDVTSSVFLHVAGSVNATIGTLFSHNIGSLFSNSSDISASIQEQQLIPWLVFNSQSLNLSGYVPTDLKPSKLSIVIQAMLKTTNVSASQVLTLNVVSAIISASSGTMTTAATSTTTHHSVLISNTSPAGTTTSQSLSSGDIVAITVPIALVSVVAIFLFIFWCIRKNHYAGSREASPDKLEISRPIPISNQNEEELVVHDTVADSDGHTTTTLSPRRYNAASTRHSQAMSNLIGGSSMYLRDSGSSGTRGRSFSENALSDFGSTWRYTQNSAYPPLRISYPRRSSVQNTRNFSRNTSLPLTKTYESFADPLAPMISERTSKVSKSSIQQTPDFAYGADDKQMRASQRHSSDQPSIFGMSRRLGGIGHGSQKSAADYPYADENPAGGGISYSTYDRVSGSQLNGAFPHGNSWVTLESAEVKAKHRCSAVSALTESTEVLNSPKNITLRHVPKSPCQPVTARLSTSTISSQLSSRRAVGPSPFFGGSTRTESRGKSRKNFWSIKGKYLHPSSSHAPVREAEKKSPEKSTIVRLRAENPGSPDFDSNLHRDSLGISYGSTREGTRQLRNYVSQLSRSVSLSLRNSLQFSDSDSRFISAEPSPRSQHSKQTGMDKDELIYNDDIHGYSPEGENSPASFNRDGYGLDESPELSQAVGARAVIRSNLPSPLLDFSSPERQTTGNAQMQEIHVSGPNRPVSSHAYEMARQKHLTASHFDVGFDDEMENSLDGLHGAFL